MESGDTMPHSQGLSNNPYPEPDQPNSLYWYLFFFKIYSNIVLPSTPRTSWRYLSYRLPVKILKALLPSSLLATWPAYLNLLDLVTLTILGEWYKLWSSSLWGLLHFKSCLYSTLNLFLYIIHGIICLTI